jgi:hypothetical protein
MTLLALLVSTDDATSDVLGRVLPALGIAVERFSEIGAAVQRYQQRSFDALIVDFEDQNAADQLLEEARRLKPQALPLTVALLADRTKARHILNSGTHFLIYKPLSDEQAKAGLRAMAALLNRERRRAQRVPVQAPVELTLADSRQAEGILLDLSETGMEVLTAEPQAAGALLSFRFRLTDGSLELQAQGQVARANPNGQNGIQFLNLDESAKAQLQAWLRAAVFTKEAGPDEMVPHCKLTDLSLGGCYVETESPFPEHALVDLCLTTQEMAVHTEGMVRVTHPGYGMGVEFPSRTPEQRAQVENLISFLRDCPQSSLELSVSPRTLTADLSQFERAPELADKTSEEMEDPLLDLLRSGTTLQQDDFLTELRRQRSAESVAT